MYPCSGIADTFGQLAYYFGNAMQSIHYATDLPALLSAIEAQVQQKGAADYNLVISALQYNINTIIDNINTAISGGTNDVNTAFSDLTSVTQEAINAFYGILNSAIGLAEGLTIPVAQVRNLYPTSVDIYHRGNEATIYWVAILV